MAFLIVGSWPQHGRVITDATCNVCSVGFVLAFTGAHGTMKPMWNCIKS